MKISKDNVKGKSLYDIYEEIYSDGTWSYYKIDETYTIDGGVN